VPRVHEFESFRVNHEGKALVSAATAIDPGRDRRFHPVALENPARTLDQATLLSSRPGYLPNSERCNGNHDMPAIWLPGSCGRGCYVPIPRDFHRTSPSSFSVRRGKAPRRAALRPSGLARHSKAVRVLGIIGNEMDEDRFNDRARKFHISVTVSPPGRASLGTPN